MIHVQTWQGSGSARVIDMTDANRRGKTCRTIHFRGWIPWGEGGANCRQFTLGVLRWMSELPSTAGFDAVADGLRGMLAAADLGPMAGDAIGVYEDQIRSIDAPKEKLVAGVDGVWAGHADEGGITLGDLTDRNNMPAEITSRQTNAQAYAIARKVWPMVQKAATMSEASNILRAAGARLHYYCRMD